MPPCQIGLKQIFKLRQQKGTINLEGFFDVFYQRGVTIYIILPSYIGRERERERERARERDISSSNEFSKDMILAKG